ncbi:MAG TPA: aminomethyltransferase beta-barrel domain-containing protein, partial [Methylococcaceae bacterium]|nr:aminomethyltransferase beta-barrel domain-containing protein [Methylococcaceae bacterium]
TEEQPIGRHEGLMYYTLGQRGGLGIGGVQGAAQDAWYVLKKDMERNVLYAGQGHDHPWLFHSALEAGSLDWVAGQPPALHFRCAAKTRYRQPDQDCDVELLDNGRCRVRFDPPQRALTPGQSVVFYDGAICLGGGVIEKAFD